VVVGQGLPNTAVVKEGRDTSEFWSEKREHFKEKAVGFYYINPQLLMYKVSETFN